MTKMKQLYETNNSDKEQIFINRAVRDTDRQTDRQTDRNNEKLWKKQLAD